jgi:hypothetical protein
MKQLKHRFVILRNEDPYDYRHWVEACQRYAQWIDYRVVDLTASDWLEKVTSLPCDLLLLEPSCKTKTFKRLYDERLQILVNELGYSCYPSLGEVLIYENKRYHAYWLQAHHIPHPPTHVFYDKRESERFLEATQYPLVAKLNIGASGNGVEILHNRQKALEYVHHLFSQGKSPRTGPRMGKGRLVKRLWHKVFHPGELINRLHTYRAISADVQKNFVLFQQYIPHSYEWRVVRIGNSFFAHKKMLVEEKASGSLIKQYCNPPLSLLDFVKNLTDRFGFYSQAVDLFEPQQGRYLVNEMQCIFGQSDPYQMLVDNQPGRYLYQGRGWVFEAGEFNSIESYDLRIRFAMDSMTLKAKAP